MIDMNLALCAVGWEGFLIGISVPSSMTLVAGYLILKSDGEK